MSQSGAAPGFFGKLPGRGDFLARRLPAGFQATWEAWLAAWVVAAKQALGAAWPDDWLTAPLWHFRLGRDLIGPDGAAGVMLASVDRVGRFFPFSVLGAAVRSGLTSGLTADGWSRQAEALALAALADDADPDWLDRALRDLGPPPAEDGAAQQAGVWPLAIDGDWPVRGPMRGPARGDAAAAWQPPGPGQSVWWCRGSARMAPVHLRAEGLPDPALAAAMVTGAFGLAETAVASLPCDAAAGAARPEDAAMEDGRAEAAAAGWRAHDPLAEDPLADASSS